MFNGLKSFFLDTYHSFKMGQFKAKWRKNNKHNLTFPYVFFDQNCVQVGKGTYGPLEVYNFGTENKLYIGNYCSIAKRASFLLAGGHNLNTFSTYPFKDMFLNSEKETLSKGDIIIEDDCWIGFNAVILSGIKIGKGSVIGASSLVTKDVPPYSIVGGVPARLIRRRFSEEIINILLDLDFNSIDLSNDNIDIVYQNIEKLSLDQIRDYVNRLNGCGSVSISERGPNK